ncbi:PREDICTED: putative cyclin-D7-1 [Ipomoea nil]|uniref:putative cyclin-D7-1 n=1 Tax=Ipomoea nil TaxID=35883 RepID=UPI000900FBF8|nr:PREDICTED: putative cyclin-D7-1 [Ipomoea nil]
MSPAGEENGDRYGEADRGGVVEKYTKEGCEEAFGILVEKEGRYMPQPGYANYLKLNRFIHNARSKAVHWLIRSRRRLNLSFESVFDAVNYLDRFISLKKCQEWKCWMFDLLAVACLSVATKFNETDPPPLHEIQMEGYENLLESDLIQRMELTVLQALGWRLSSTTPYSYLHLLTASFHFQQTLSEPEKEELRSHITDMLLGALLDPKLVEFRPCVLAETALKCSLEEFLPLETNSSSCFNHFTALIPQDHKNDLEKCEIMMDKGLIQNVRTCGRLYCPSSPVTVLTTKHNHSHSHSHSDCSLLINMQQTLNINLGSSSIKKRKRHPEDSDPMPIPLI